ncbi:MAG: radical SAM protein [Candidatus Omnitrophica bacterium]|nr:radical SAM protein [Candidatus Omnitrophota bacterium]
MSNYEPCYLKFSQGELFKIRDDLVSFLSRCGICPRLCKVNRISQELGFCKTGRLARVSSFNLHFGEEKELVGRGGSGTIFFSFCNLACVYCQNYTISHLGEGSEIEAYGLAKIMLGLQELGAENINFVSPTHVVPQIIEALVYARDKGLRLPLVYNSGGYDLEGILAKLKGIFDIYMPDIKYSDDSNSGKYSQAQDYWQVCKLALLEMYRQVGDLVIDDQGIAQKGMLIRHLVLPNDLSGSFEVIDFIAGNISCNTYINIMDQYRPCHKAYRYKELSRRITQDEYSQVVNYARKKGLRGGPRD